MEGPRPEKVAVVQEVRDRLTSSGAAILTEYRADTRSRGVVQVPIGKVSFTADQLLANFRAVIEELQRAKPAAAKGKYVKSVAVSSTMGPGIRVDSNRLRVTEEELAQRGA